MVSQFYRSWLKGGPFCERISVLDAQEHEVHRMGFEGIIYSHFLALCTVWSCLCVCLVLEAGNLQEGTKRTLSAMQSTAREKFSILLIDKRERLLGTAMISTLPEDLHAPPSLYGATPPIPRHPICFSLLWTKVGWVSSLALIQKEDQWCWA